MAVSAETMSVLRRFRREIHRVSDDGNASSRTGELGQKLGEVPKPER